MDSKKWMGTELTDKVGAPTLWHAFEMGFGLRSAMLGHVLDGRDVGRLTTSEFWHPSMQGMHKGTDLHVGLTVGEAIVKLKNEVRRRLDAIDSTSHIIAPVTSSPRGAETPENDAKDSHAQELADALDAILSSDVGRQTLNKLADGQGTETVEVKAWLAAKALLTEYKASSGLAMRWPQRRDVARLDDMSPEGHLRISLDNDNDVSVQVFDGQRFASVEFCAPGGGGGGQSSRTRQALIEVMRAIEADNAERPNRAHRKYS